MRDFVASSLQQNFSDLLTQEERLLEQLKMMQEQKNHLKNQLEEVVKNNESPTLKQKSVNEGEVYFEETRKQKDQHRNS